MKKDKFIRLLSKKLSNEITAEEQQLLDTTLQEREIYRQLAMQFENYFKEHKQENAPVEQLDQVWAVITANKSAGYTEQFNYDSQPQKLFSTVFFKVAAVLALVVGIGFLSYHFYHRNNGEMNALRADDTKIFKVLEDGTGIWLNKKSNLTYNKAFGEQKREIFLDGEAYFDVAKNAKIPLIIHAGAIDIEVKGTAFNVNAYKQNKAVQIALVKGIVAVSDRQNPTHQVLLKPNDLLVFHNRYAIDGQQHFQVLELTSQTLLKETSWAADTLVFNKEKLQDLAIKLEKKYDLKIEIHSDKLKEKRFSGMFINETIQQALEALKLSYPLTYTIQQRLVIIKD